MKKNLVFKLGLFCAALVLIATCFVSSAWAKYTTTVKASDTATVAKFEFGAKDDAGAAFDESSVGTIDIFETTYFDHIKNDGTNNTVGGKKLIAPGSYGTFSVVVSSSSQVALDIAVVATVTGADVPLKWYVGTDRSGTGHESLQDAFNAIAAGEKHLEATDGTSTVSKTYTITWEWKYEGNPGGDLADTNLGKANQDLTATITVTATQTLPVEK